MKNRPPGPLKMDETPLIELVASDCPATFKFPGRQRMCLCGEPMECVCVLGIENTCNPVLIKSEWQGELNLHECTTGQGVCVHVFLFLLQGEDQQSEEMLLILTTLKGRLGFKAWFEGWDYYYILVRVIIRFGTMRLFLMVVVLYTSWLTLRSVCLKIVIDNNPPVTPVMTRQLQPSMTFNYRTTHIILYYFFLCTESLSLPH